MVELAELEEDETMLADLYTHLTELKASAKQQELVSLLSGQYDKNDAYPFGD